MRMASTKAKIGRSMKNRAMRLPRMSELELACGEFGLRVLRGGLVRGHLRAGGHLHSGLCLLQAADDESVAGGETLGDDPLIPERAVDLDAAFFDLAIGPHANPLARPTPPLPAPPLPPQNPPPPHTPLA